MNTYQSTIERLIEPVGVHINGSNYSDILVHNDHLYSRILHDGSLGLGESYMEGWWDCHALDDFLYKLLNADLEKKIRRNIHLVWLSLKASLFNRQSRSKAADVAGKHYNLDNKFFSHMLDKLMIYSCAYWNKAENLDEAQEHKLDLICRKLKLSKGDTVLDIGCGWGGFAWYAATKYGARVTGITISSEQADLAKKRCQGLPVDIRLQDYRDINEQYNKIVSVGMFEHVGHKNYSVFMDMVYRNLTPDGIFLLHTIGGNESTSFTDPWIDKYIFPNGTIPSANQITRAIEPHFILQDWHNFGPDYDKTLMEWRRRFKQSWSLFSHKFDEHFYRMWDYYLCISAASFRAKTNNLWQIVLTKTGYPAEYHSVR